MGTETEALAAGQSWTYHTPVGFESSRLIVGAVVRFENNHTIICATATDVPVRHGAEQTSSSITMPGMTNIAFIPMSEAAFRASVISVDETSVTPPDADAFQSAIQAWQADPKGLSVFTVPFEGSLDRMIALQMADIVNQPAA